MHFIKIAYKTLIKTTKLSQSLLQFILNKFKTFVSFCFTARFQSNQISINDTQKQTKLCFRIYSWKRKMFFFSLSIYIYRRFLFTMNMRIKIVELRLKIIDYKTSKEIRLCNATACIRLNSYQRLCS